MGRKRKIRDIPDTVSVATRPLEFAESDTFAAFTDDLEKDGNSDKKKSQIEAFSNQIVEDENKIEKLQASIRYFNACINYLRLPNKVVTNIEDIITTKLVPYVTDHIDNIWIQKPENFNPRAVSYISNKRKFDVLLGKKISDTHYIIKGQLYAFLDTYTLHDKLHEYIFNPTLEQIAKQIPTQIPLTGPIYVTTDFMNPVDVMNADVGVTRFIFQPS